MKQVVPGFLMTYPTASSRTIRTPVAREARASRVISDRVAGDGDVEVDLLRPFRGPERGPDPLLLAPVASIVTVENGASGLRRKIRATSASAGSPPGHTLSSVRNRSADGDARP